MTIERRDELSTADMVEAGGRPSALLPGDESGTLRRRWDTIQTGFSSLRR